MLANVAAALVYLGEPQLIIGATNFAVIAVAVAVVVAGAILLTRRDVAFTAVLVWALAGIYVKQTAVPEIAYAALAGIVIIAVGSVLTLILVWTRRKPSDSTIRI
jgi:hypothetical protein